MKSTEGGAVLWMLFEGTGKQTTPSEGEPPQARALQWGHSPFSLTGLRLNSHGAEAQRPDPPSKENNNSNASETIERFRLKGIKGRSHIAFGKFDSEKLEQEVSFNASCSLLII